MNEKLFEKLHNSEMGDWGECPQTVPQQGNGMPPGNCNQVYREPYMQAGRIYMRTRGTGTNDRDDLNQTLGRGQFEDLDEEMIDAITEDADHLCPSN